MSDCNLDVIAKKLKVPFGSATLANRKQLMLFSILGLMVTVLGVQPTKIEMLGIELSASNQKYLLWFILLGICHYLIAFIVSFLSDLTSWKVLFVKKNYETLMDLAGFDLSHLKDKQIIKQLKLEGDITNRSKILLYFRLLIDILPHLALSIFSLKTLLFKIFI